MILKPQVEVELFDPLQSVLFEAGLTKKEEQQVDSKRNKVIQIFEDSGAGLENVAAAVANSLTDESQRLRAADLVLRLHQLFEKEGEAVDNRITVLVNGDNTQVAAILNPRRESSL